MNFKKLIIIILLCSCQTTTKEVVFQDFVNNKLLDYTNHINNNNDSLLTLLSFKQLKFLNPNNTWLEKDFYVLTSELYNLNFVNAGLIADKIISRTNPNSLEAHQTVLIKNRINELTYANKPSWLNDLRDFDIRSWETDFLSQYKYLNYLRSLASFYSSQGEYVRAMASLSYGLWLINRSNYNHKRTTADFLSSLGTFQLNERIEGLEYAAAKNLKTASIIYEQVGLFDNAIKSYINYANTAFIDNNKMMSILDSIKLSRNKISPLTEYYIYINKGFCYYLSNNHELAVRNYLKAINVINDECSKMRFDLNYYLSESYLELNKIDSARYYLNEAKNFLNCNSKNKYYIDFYTSDIESKLSLQDKKTRVDFKIAKIFGRRDGAKNLFPNKSEFHLGDFYAQNTSQIIDAFLSTENSLSPKKYNDTIRHLFNDTKTKTENLASYSEDKSERKFLSNNEANKKLDIYLREVNDFKDTDNYDRDVYKKIYELLESIDDSQVSNSYIPEGLNNDSTPIFHTLKYQNNYYSYLNYHNDIYLHKVSDKVVSDFLEYVTRTNKSLRPNNKDSLVYYKKLLLPTVFSSFDEVLIIADGLFDFIPLDLLLSDKPNFKVHYDIRDRTFDSQVSKLAREGISIFSFSDLTTINSSEVKEVSDLHNGHLECEEIASLFDQTQLFYGYDCTINNLKKSNNADILHISTHGIINTNNRGDNYLLFRSDNKDLDSLFISDVSMLNLEAKFVSLAACETTKGMHLDGSGVFSLSKAFLKNGTQTVLNTLWKIDDKATKEFMVKFYERWLTGISVLDAQHQAKQYLRDSTEYSHPYYWAGFALEGNPNLYLSE